MQRIQMKIGITVGAHSRFQLISSCFVCNILHFLDLSGLSECLGPNIMSVNVRGIDIKLAHSAEMLGKW
jgi:hypothetical protein